MSLFIWILTHFMHVCNGQVITVHAADLFFSAGAYSKNFGDVFSANANPAALALLNTFSAGVRTERKFLLADLNRHCMMAGGNTKMGAIGVRLNYFGYAGYAEVSPGIGYAKRLGAVDIGIKFNYQLISIQGYGKTSGIIPEFGTLWHLSEKLHTGVYLSNPIGDKKFAQLFALGLGYEFSDILLGTLIICREENKPVTSYTGIQYQFAKKFYAKAGLSVHAGQLFFASGWQWQLYRVEVTSCYQQQLGFSPGLMFIYQPRKNEE